MLQTLLLMTQNDAECRGRSICVLDSMPALKGATTASGEFRRLEIRDTLTQDGLNVGLGGSYHQVIPNSTAFPWLVTRSSLGPLQIISHHCGGRVKKIVSHVAVFLYPPTKLYLSLWPTDATQAPGPTSGAISPPQASIFDSRL